MRPFSTSRLGGNRRSPGRLPGVLLIAAIATGCASTPTAPAVVPTATAPGGPHATLRESMAVGSPLLGPSASLDSIPSANATDAAFADAAAASAFASMDTPALYVGVWDPARGSFVRAYGHAVRGGATATPDDAFRVASITKTFTTTVVLELARRGGSISMVKSRRI